ncbi:UNVERIFIED_CONTAM: hypothetical protein FKN15_061209 [Acipenser sinensis]
MVYWVRLRTRNRTVVLHRDRLARYLGYDRGDTAASTSASPSPDSPGRYWGTTVGTLQQAPQPALLLTRRAQSSATSKLSLTQPTALSLPPGDPVHSQHTRADDIEDRQLFSACGWITTESVASRWITRATTTTCRTVSPQTQQRENLL